MPRQTGLAKAELDKRPMTVQLEWVRCHDQTQCWSVARRALPTTDLYFTSLWCTRALGPSAPSKHWWAGWLMSDVSAKCQLHSRSDSQVSSTPPWNIMPAPGLVYKQCRQIRPVNNRPISLWNIPISTSIYSSCCIEYISWIWFDFAS